MPSADWRCLGLATTTGAIGGEVIEVIREDQLGKQVVLVTVIRFGTGGGTLAVAVRG